MKLRRFFSECYKGQLAKAAISAENKSLIAQKYIINVGALISG
ncbi:hypothetical protein [Alkalihalobacillus sp. BA299]|nr:hypothetical protein [Alkalihalobacillus sp. BA299]